MKKAGRVIAVEFDRNLAPILRENLSSSANFSLIEADALVVDLCAEIKPATSARLVANLPYNISTAILQRLIEQRSCLGEMVVISYNAKWLSELRRLQDRRQGYLSVLVEAYCEAEKLLTSIPELFAHRLRYGAP